MMVKSILNRNAQRESTLAIRSSGAAEHQERLRSQAQAALERSGYWAVAQLKCEVIDRDVVVCGVVPSFHLKQVAQSVLLRLNEAEHVVNRVDVVDVLPP